MLTTIPDLPEGVLGFVAHHDLTAADYRETLEPALLAEYPSGRKPNVLFVMAADFTGLAADAMWEDVSFGVRHLTGWGKIAIVGDGGWIIHASRLAAHLVPGRIETYPPEDQDAAIRWLSA